MTKMLLTYHLCQPWKLVKIETAAGRVVANELLAIVGTSDYGAKDDLGR